MDEEIQFIIDSTKEGMDNALMHLTKKFINIRAGKAMPSMVSSVMVDYYGTPTPISQVANVSTPDGMTISIQPWEKSLIPEIEKGIHLANIGFNPMNNGESIIITIPPLTEERRKELVKIAKSEIEKAKISIRNSRKEANNDIKKCEVSLDQKSISEDDVQNLTNKYITQIDKIYSVKEKEILSV